VILGIGLGAAGLAHPSDASLNARLVGSKSAERFWVPGHIVGSDYVQFGAAVGLYVIGRYIVRPAPGEPRTNKLSHLGFDLLRAHIVSQAFSEGIKIAVSLAPRLARRVVGQSSAVTGDPTTRSCPLRYVAASRSRLRGRRRRWRIDA